MKHKSAKGNSPVASSKDRGVKEDGCPLQTSRDAGKFGLEMHHARAFPAGVRRNPPNNALGSKMNTVYHPLYRTRQKHRGTLTSLQSRRLHVAVMTSQVWGTTSLQQILLAHPSGCQYRCVVATQTMPEASSSRPPPFDLRAPMSLSLHPSSPVEVSSSPRPPLTLPSSEGIGLPLFERRRSCSRANVPTP